MAQAATSVLSRFEAKYQPDPTTGCWLWTAALLKDGYGAFNHGGRAAKPAHRASYELAYGDIPPGMSVLHRCDTPSCVNPDHLFLGTQLDNMRDRDAKGHRASTTGENNANAKLTAAQSIEIRRRAKHATQAALASEYGVSQFCISDIVRGRRWRSTIGGDLHRT